MKGFMILAAVISTMFVSVFFNPPVYLCGDGGGTNNTNTSTQVYVVVPSHQIPLIKNS